MQVFTLSNLYRRAGEIVDHALVEPVVLTKHGRNQLVMLSTKQFEQMTGISLAAFEQPTTTAPAKQKRVGLAGLRSGYDEEAD